MTILTILIPAVVAAGLAVLAAVLHRTGGLWLVQSPATPRHDPDASRATLDAPGAVQRRAIEAPRTRLIRLHPEPGRLKKQG